jgi:UDP-N-acetyl-D-glucosamine/UDP-N-acetyl-D-galactosamine dehydrogenase
MMNFAKIKITVIGLGYVGLPLAAEFGKKYQTLGFDINSARISELEKGQDHTLELTQDELSAARHLSFTSDSGALKDTDVYIVTVPTPIDNQNQPNLGPLASASELIGKVIKAGAIVIYESTVYPGATEEFCIPIVERVSGLTYNIDFFAGYSPERINPGDKQHRVTTITKVTSGSTPEIATYIDGLYGSIITAGTFKAGSIRVAEAAKVIENTQRDINIALINELAIIFSKLDIDTEDVLLAAGTKWNFLPFRPGLVGGHCIGVDPYYLTYKAQSVGYNPEVILAGRRINNGMAKYVVELLIKGMLKKRIHVRDSKVLVMGLTFKENCPDIRNTKVIDIINELLDYDVNVDVFDPWIEANDVISEYGITPVIFPEIGVYDAVLIAVGHDHFRDMGVEGIDGFAKQNRIIFDLKNVLPKHFSDIRL